MCAVSGESGMLMTNEAATRYEEARTEFEAAHARWTLPTSGTTMSMRHRHQKEESLGMLGHPLGLAMDFAAEENPNLKGENKEFPGLNEFMVRRFGGGRSQMAISVDAVEQLGKNTANKVVGAQDQTTLDQVTLQFNEIARTSANFMTALSPEQKRGLRVARNAYFDLPALRAERAKLDKSNADPKRLDTVNKLIERKERELKVGVADAFTPWTAALQGESAVDAGSATMQTSNVSAYKAGIAGFAKLDKDGIQRTGALLGLERKAFKGSDGKYKTKIRALLAEKKEAAEGLVKTYQFKIKKRQELIKKLGDHKKLFGTGTQRADGTWATEQRVSEVAVMQLIEHGHVQQTGKAGRDGRTEMFNAEAAAMLAKYGFAPGSNFGDTMHFDFIEGYSKAFPGGRKAARGKRIGPNGIVDAKGS